MRPPSTLRVAILLSLASQLGMLSFSSFAALLPDFQALWSLSNSEAGWISGVYYLGYVVGVPILVGATDRYDPRRIFLGSLVLGAVASLLFALFAAGFWSALAFRFLAGIALAGTYMPGLKLLTDLSPSERHSRYTAIYTVGFGIATAVSFAYTGQIASLFGWQVAFAGAAVGAFMAMAMTLLVPAAPPAPAPGRRLDFRAVVRNRAAMAYVLGYCGHTWELFAARAWLVAFLVHADRSVGGAGEIAAINWVTTALVFLSAFSSFAGAEVAARRQRRRIVGTVMALSAGMSVVAGFSAGAPFALVVALCLVYHLLIMADSAALTGGAVTSAAPGQRGATLAVHAVFGFTGGFLGPLAMGLVLDAAGGAQNGLAWGLAFMTGGLGSALALIAVRRL